MSDEARSLLALLALLPDGIANEDLRHVHAAGRSAAATLREVGLAFEDDGRLRVLKPVRDHVARRHPPPPDELAHMVEYYCGLARAQAPIRLVAESRNLEAAVALGLEAPDPRPAIRAAISLAKLVRLGGSVSPALLESAWRAARLLGEVPLEAAAAESLGDVALARADHDAARARYQEALLLHERVRDLLGQAGCIERLGDVALARADHERARDRYHEALPLYERVRDLLGQANCTARLADIDLERSDHERAGERYQRALRLYQRVGDPLGRANCIKRLGDIAFARAHHERAGERYEEALQLYTRAGDVLGRANCIKRLGDIALSRSDRERAGERYEEALPLYEQAGNLLGQANCTKGLGDAALQRSDEERASERYEAALPLYEQAGSLLGQANCIKALGDIALERSDDAGARERWELALALYARIREPYSIGWTHRRLARVAQSDAEKSRHLRAAEEAWRGIERDDLVEKLHA